MDEVTQKTFLYSTSPDQRWHESRTGISGNLRHRGTDHFAEGSASLTVTVLDVLDGDGNSTPALICSAAGVEYGVPVGGQSAAGVVASRPVRQVDGGAGTRLRR